MKKIRLNILVIVAIAIIQLVACTSNLTKQEKAVSESNTTQSQAAFRTTLEQHLNAVSNKNPVALKNTMSPEGKMQLILPGTEILTSVDSFMNYHEEWFQDTTWTFETRILNTEIGDKIGIAITEIIYKEPDRNGSPYFNRMIVSYGLEKINDKWYIIKDHASSIEKSTDKK